MGLASGCTKPNPKSCQDGTCTDPAFPFCDVDGALAGEAETCIAVACTANEFVACRGDRAITCNATGTDYELVQCDRGCDAAASGCRLCDPSETACTNGTVATCDSSGVVVTTEACTLGCFENEPRCREIAPSNGLAPYMDMAASGPDLVLENATVFVPSGIIMSSAGPITIASPIVPAVQNGVRIQIFPVRSLTVIGTLDVRGSQADDVPAVAFLVHGEVRIDGSIHLSGSEPFETVTSPPGSVISGPCVGTGGTFDVAGQPAWGAGGGGGGGATQGGAGGSNWKWPGSSGGVAFPNPDLQPLRGGCRGGGHPSQPPTHGGGAIQITSRESIRLGPNSTIRANGGWGFIGETPSGEVPGNEGMPKGGGAGGGILLEAPSVMFDSGVKLTADGGGGASGDGDAGSSSAGGLPSLGGTCTISPTICTNGGDGGSSAGPSRTAASISTTGLQQVYTGAGGGSVGHIRINTRDSAYTKANDAHESPVPSTGTIGTR